MMLATSDLRHAGRALLDAWSDQQPFDPYCLDRRDPRTVEALLPIFESISQSYLRADVSGLENLPSGKALYVANHNGGILGPDIFCTLAMLWRHHGPGAPLYAMAHDFAMRTLTPLGRVLQRVGALRADPENARRALAERGSVLVYPGGELDAYRPFWRRNEVVFGKRTGFVRLAKESGVPIVPIVAHGAHRSAVIFHEGQWLARALGLKRWSRIDRFPLAFGLPWVIGAGPWIPYLPLPFKIRLRVLPPVSIGPEDDPEQARDEVVTRMQAAMREAAGQR